MKPIIILLYGLGALFGIVNSQNLVQNFSFETVSPCPNPTLWGAYQNSPDKFNTCNSTVPNNFAGTQTPRTGNGYVAIVDRHASANYHEYTGVQLSSPLIVGQTYCVEYYISLTELSQWGANNMGVQFNTSAIGVQNGISQVYTTAVVTDKTNWTQIAGSFVATQAYTHVAVGNFFTDAATTLGAAVGGTYNGAYYYIEDVSVSLCTVLSQAWKSANSTTEGRKVNLEWEFSLNNIKTYQIERSLDGTHYKKIAEIEAQTNLNSFFDLPMTYADEAFYRIRAIDENGKTHLSRILIAQLKSSLNKLFTLSPNPILGGETLQLQPNVFSGPTQMIIRDNLGRITKSESWSETPLQIRILTSEMEKGVYFVEIITGGKRGIEKLVIY